ncbi:YgaB family protein [Peribacillus butanolivorans]|uniref:YgaB family protein n=1 Tax=Peribacillus butanolivorans TaxID=421767 RepID=UPI002E1D8555|nr:YgaB family protein [Peribacillus butanolivorans]
MEQFNQLINNQLKTMEKLLLLQSEIERCQDIEKQLLDLQEESEVVTIQEEIQLKKQELKCIHDMFERQTEEVIRYFQQGQAAVQ